MTRTVYALVGCPCSGKSWLAERIKQYFTYLPHDDYIEGMPESYLSAMKAEAADADKPLLIEIPFSLNTFKIPLTAAGFDLKLLVIQEIDIRIASRYHARTGKPIPPGHLTRQRTFRQRANDAGIKGYCSPTAAWFANPAGCMGTSVEILKWVRRKFKSEAESGIPF